MVGLAIGTIVLGAAVTIFLTASKHSRDTINSARLNQELQTAVQMMSEDIRRAGYWGQAITGIDSGSNDNPFMTTATDITINASNNCILLTYDRDSDGVLPNIGTGTDDERYGYRLSNQALQSRPTGASFSCTAAASDWENITDPNVVQITAFTVTNNQSSVPIDAVSNLILRRIDISVTGQLTTDTSYSKTLVNSIRVRNDKFVP